MTPCPRCHGAMLPSEDVHGRYMYCLGCGKHVDLPPNKPPPRPPVGLTPMERYCNRTSKEMLAYSEGEL